LTSAIPARHRIMQAALLADHCGAVRAGSPSSGASTCTDRAAAAGCSARCAAPPPRLGCFFSVTYWLIWLALSAPELCRLRARSVATASALSLRLPANAGLRLRNLGLWRRR
jgi:hypothetical protein